MRTGGPQDRYELLGELGRGGMGIVYRARDRASGQECAIKVLSGHASEKARKRFERERRAMVGLSHPHLVALRDAGVHQGTPYLVLDLIEGESLAMRLRRGPMDFEEAIRIGRALCDALLHVHSTGVLHRDVKPSNVLIDPTGKPLLTDFGLTRSVDGQGTRISLTGQFLGTPGYWAPEQALGLKEKIGTATDVYGFGALMYELVAGRPPCEVSSVFELREALERPPRPLSEHRPEVPKALEQLILGCLAREPEDRPSMADVADALDGLDRAGPEQSQKGKGPLVVGALLLLFAAGGGAALALRPAVTPETPLASATATETATPGATPTPSETPSPLAPARAALAAGDSAKAMQIADALIAERPDYADARLLRAALLVGSRRYADAIQECDRVLEKAPGDLWARKIRAAACAITGKHSEAIAEFEQVLAGLEDPNHVGRTRGVGTKVQITLGLVNSLLVRNGPGDQKQVQALVTKGLELEPENPDLRLHRGNLRQSVAGKEDEAGHQAAIADFTVVIASKPSATVHISRAHSRGILSDYDGAEEDYDAAVALEPRNPFGLYGRGLMRERRYDYDGALNDYAAATECFPEGHPQKPRAQQQVERHRLRARQEGRPFFKPEPFREPQPWERTLPRGPDSTEPALAVLEQVLEKSPKDGVARLERALLNRAQKKLREALADAELATELTPKRARAWVVLGTIQLERREPEAALKALEQAKALDPGDPYVYARLGTACGWLERHADALRHLDRALAFGLRDPTIFLNRARALMGLKRWREAIPAYEGALRAGAKRSAETTHSLGRCHLERGRFAQAIPLLEEAVRLEPTFAVGWADLALARQLEQEFAKAIEAARTALAVDNSLTRAWQVLCRSLDASGQHERAIEAWSGYYALDETNFRAIWARAEAYEKAGKPKLALADYERIVTDANEDPPLQKFAKEAVARLRGAN